VTRWPKPEARPNKNLRIYWDRTPGRGSARVDAGAVREGQAAGDDRARRYPGVAADLDVEKIDRCFRRWRSRRSLCWEEGQWL